MKFAHAIAARAIDLPYRARTPRLGGARHEVSSTTGTPQPRTVTMTRAELLGQDQGRLGRPDDRRNLRRPDRSSAIRRVSSATKWKTVGDPDYVRTTMLNAAGVYDDIYMDLTFVAVIDRLGIDAPADSMAMAFAHDGYPLWHANQAARYNILNGMMPPASGHWCNNPHADDIDFQIEADFAGSCHPPCPTPPRGYATARDT